MTVLKPVFLIAIATVAMVEVMVPSVFDDCTLSLPFEILE